VKRKNRYLFRYLESIKREKQSKKYAIKFHVEVVRNLNNALENKIKKYSSKLDVKKRLNWSFFYIYKKIML